MSCYQTSPIIKILSKSDLADTSVTLKWQSYYNGRVIATNILKDNTLNAKIIHLAKKIVMNRGTVLKPIRILVFGIPNVGKSTLINNIAKKKIAKTGNEPAVTKAQQKIHLDKTVYIMDTPGIMFPSPKNEECGYRLAIIGSIRDTAMDYPTTAVYLLEYLKNNYTNLLKKSYPNIDFSQDPDQTLNNIAKNLGCYQKHHVAEKFVNRVRNGKFGEISLEHPKEYMLLSQS